MEVLNSPESRMFICHLCTQTSWKQKCLCRAPRVKRDIFKKAQYITIATKYNKRECKTLYKNANKNK